MTRDEFEQSVGPSGKLVKDMRQDELITFAHDSFSNAEHWEQQYWAIRQTSMTTPVAPSKSGGYIAATVLVCTAAALPALVGLLLIVLARIAGNG
jgi:hypothetical protein